MSEALAAIDDADLIPLVAAANLPASLAQRYSGLAFRTAELVEAGDRAPETIETEGQAQAATDFIAQIADAQKRLEAARKESKKPYDDAGKAVQRFFVERVDKLTFVKDRMQQRLTPFIQAKADAERKAREEAAAQAKAAAEAAAQAPQTREELKEAERLARDARRAERAVAAPAGQTGGDLGETHLRTTWDFEFTDAAKIDLEALRQHFDVASLEKAVRAYIKAGGRDLAGVKIFRSDQGGHAHRLKQRETANATP